MLGEVEVGYPVGSSLKGSVVEAVVYRSRSCVEEAAVPLSGVVLDFVHEEEAAEVEVIRVVEVVVEVERVVDDPRGGNRLVKMMRRKHQLTLQSNLSAFEGGGEVQTSISRGQSEARRGTNT